MALQTQTHTSSTAADAPTSTANDSSSSNDNSTSAFSPAGSPPLILAFLAIGLFSAAMIVVFGWRRIQFGRFSIGGPPPLHFRETSKAMTVLPQKPKLWEMWNSDEITWNQVSGNSKKGASVYDGQWTNMMPFSANAVSTDASSSDNDGIIRHTSEPSSTTEPSPPTDRGFTSIRQALSDRWPRPSPHRPIERAPAAEKDAFELQSPRSSTTPSKTLQVGVAIILPSAQYPVYIRERTQIGHSEESRPRRRKEPPDYSIGLYDCSWE